MLKESLGLAEDAPLRMRVWWGFWRGWRKVMVGLVVLVAVGVWTRPGKAEHIATAVRLLDSVHADPALTERVGNELATAGRTPRARRYWHATVVSNAADGIASFDFEDYRLFSIARARKDWATCGGDVVFSDILTIGAFGYVWVLD